MFDKREARFRTEHCRATLDMLKRHEGACLHGGLHVAYRCPAGALTIGWGHNLDARPVPGLGEGSALSEAQAESLLRRDAADFAAALDIRLPWWRRTGPARSAVLLDMAFNLGPDGLLGFGRMLDAARRGDFCEAARQMLDSRWAGQVGVRAVELAEQMESGRWIGLPESGTRGGKGGAERGRALARENGGESVGRAEKVVGRGMGNEGRSGRVGRVLCAGKLVTRVGCEENDARESRDGHSGRSAREPRDGRSGHAGGAA